MWYAPCSVVPECASCQLPVSDAYLRILGGGLGLAETLTGDPLIVAQAPVGQVGQGRVGKQELPGAELARAGRELGSMTEESDLEGESLLLQTQDTPVAYHHSMRVSGWAPKSCGKLRGGSTRAELLVALGTRTLVRCASQQPPLRQSP